MIGTSATASGITSSGEARCPQTETLRNQTREEEERNENTVLRAQTECDHVASNAKLSRFDALLYLFVDNEAVIKMIIKGRSPTTRHVSRTYRVALDWLFDRTNLDLKIHTKYVDTKNQLADILTKGCFSRDEWNHLLCLFNIMNHSMFSSSHISQIIDPQAMSQRQIQEGKQGGENERVVAKSRVARNLVSMTNNPSPSVLSSSFSQRSGDLTVNCSTPDSLSTGKISAMDSNKNNIRLSSVAHRY